MAQQNSLEKAIQKMIDNVETVAEVAGKLVMKKVQKDFEEATKNVVDEYYDYKYGSYTKYGRQYNLYNIYNVSSDFKKYGKTYTITTNVHMDSSALEGVYHSNSSKHQGSGPWESGGQVEADYVFENFLEGEHPWTRFLGDGKYKYGEKRDRMSPKQKLNQYIKNYEDKYFNDYMTKTIARLLELYM
jgi:hypothetical protein